MIPADLRAITLSLNDERGTGGQSKLDRLLGWDYSTLWGKLNGKSPITESDALAIQKALELAGGQYPRVRRSAQKKPQPSRAGVNFRTESIGSDANS